MIDHSYKERSRYYGVDVGERELSTLATACCVSGSIMLGGYTEIPVYRPDPKKELRRMVIRKFIRQLVPDPARHSLITKHFDESSVLLLMLMAFPDRVYRTAVALEREELRKEDIDYENIFFQGGDDKKSFSLNDEVKGPEKEEARKQSIAPSKEE